MDDEGGDRNSLMLDTSIILPIAVAGGITLVIIIFVYCCRRYQSMMGNRGRGLFGRSYETSTTEETGRQNNGCGRRVLGRRTSSNANASRVHRCMPWNSGRDYQRNWVATDEQTAPQVQSGVPYRTNYNSTHSTTAIGQVSCSNYGTLT